MAVAQRFASPAEVRLIGDLRSGSGAALVGGLQCASSGDHARSDLRPRFEGRLRIFLASCVLAVAAGAGAQGTERYAIVASGGVSLGSYQAGVSYALVQDLVRRNDNPAAGKPRPELAVVTGASAGNINAFLAALTWFQDRSFSATRNLFWDTWINVGWEQLSPDDHGRYCSLFDHPLTDDEGFPRQCCREGTGGRCGALAKEGGTYTTSDGLLSRRAFAAVEDNVQRLLERMAKGGGIVTDRNGSSPALRLGVTMTRSSPRTELVQKALPVPVQRYAVPLSLQPVCAQRPCRLEIANADDPWVERHERAGTGPFAGAGRLAFLPRSCDPKHSPSQVSIAEVLKIVEASAAFPFAFAPVEVAVSEKPGLVTCATPQQRTTRFFDGGVFDNVPLGLAIALNDEAKDDIRYFYVHPDAVRSEYSFPADDRRRRGSAYVSKVLGNYLDEGRKYELQGIARFNTAKLHLDKRGFVATTRFFPVLGEMLVAAFGAFMAQSYRVHDYLIGVYDGLFALAADEVGRERDRTCSDPDCFLPEEVERWNEEQWTAVSKRFLKKMTDLIGLDEQIIPDFADRPPRYQGVFSFSMRAFLADLLDYEQRWASPLSQARRQAIVRETLGDSLQRHIADLHQHCDNPVWRIHHALRELDARGRLLARSGSRDEIAAFVELRDSFGALIQLAGYGPDTQPPRGPLDPARFLMDEKRCSDESALVMPDIWQWAPWYNTPWSKYRGTEGFEFTAADRVLRRAAELERRDEDSRDSARALLKSESLPAWLFPLGRLAYASAVERDDHLIEFQPGTVKRLLQGHTLESLAYLLPNSVTFGHVQELLWSLRVRPRLYGVFGGLDVGPFLMLQKGEFATVGYRASFGLGYDPAGRIFDDVQLSWSMWREQPCGLFCGSSVTGHLFDYAGPEISFVLFTKIRFALAAPRLIGIVSRPSIPERLTDLQFSVGLTDLNGIAVTLANMITGSEGRAEVKP